MDFFGYNWKDKIYSKSAERVNGLFQGYLKSRGVGNVDPIKESIYANSLAAATLVDWAQDPNPDPKAKATSLGSYFRGVLGRARKGKGDNPAWLDDLAWGGARSVYDNLWGQVLFDPKEVQGPFFAEVMGVVVADAAGTVAAVAAVYVTKDPQVAATAKAGVTDLVMDVGAKFRERLGTQFAADGGIVFLSPADWPKRAERNAKIKQIEDTLIAVEIVKLQTAMANAQAQMLVANHNLKNTQAQIAAEDAAASNAAKTGNLTETQKAALALKKKQIVQTAGIAGGGAAALLLLVLLLRK
jgi:hypothetical protein